MRNVHMRNVGKGSINIIEESIHSEGRALPFTNTVPSVAFLRLQRDSSHLPGAVIRLWAIPV